MLLAADTMRWPLLVRSHYRRTFASFPRDPVYFRMWLCARPAAWTVATAPLAHGVQEDCLRHVVRKYLLALGAVCALTLFAGCRADAVPVAHPTATKAAVVISMQNVKYMVSEPLGILIQNSGSKTVYAIDGRAYCTILQLQMFVPQQKAWVVVDRCRDKAPPHVLAIRAGMSEPFTLAPTSDGDPNSWATGTYRIALAYSAHDDGKTEAQTAYSQGFTITSS